MSRHGHYIGILVLGMGSGHNRILSVRTLFPYASVPAMGHFTVVSLVTWHWIGSEAGGDLVLIQTSLLFICRSCCSYAN